MRFLLLALLAALCAAQTVGTVTGGTLCSDRDQKTVGTCRILDCWDSRGPTDCRDSECWCQAGYYTADDETCIACPSECSGPQGNHGSKHTRTMYAASEVNAPASCDSEQQCQDCNDGTWSAWSGNGYMFDSCVVRSQCQSDSGMVGNGESEARVMYQASSVNALDECVLEDQSRLCSDGVFGTWSGSFTEESCDVKERCEGGVRNGETVTRVKYERASVNEPEQCVSETQSRMCVDGRFNDWQGVGYMQNDCVVMAQCQEPVTTHGESETRIRYQFASVNAPDLCLEEVQTRGCNDGVWESWSGTYTEETCVVRAQCKSPDARSGDSEDRLMFLTNQVRAPEECTSEKQTRTCFDGDWGQYDGTYGFGECYQLSQCQNPVARHDETDSRTMYRESEVALPETCDVEEQTRICNDGDWSTFAPLTFTMETCRELATCEGPDASSGETNSRARYEAKSVNAPDQCQEEVQTASCHDGDWSEFYPNNFGEKECTVMRQCEKPTTRNGGEDTRTRWESSEVNEPAQCQSEVQTRTCHDGTFTAFTGANNYQESGCVVRKMCQGTVNGDSETQVRYEHSSEKEGTACNAQTQTRTCNDGTFTSWSPNNFKRKECYVNTCASHELNVELKVVTQGTGSSVAWSVGNSCSGDGYDKDDTYKAHCCLPAGTYALTCTDLGSGWDGAEFFINDQRQCTGAASKTVHIGTCDQRADDLEHKCDAWYKWCWMSEWQSTCVNGMCECVDNYFSTDQQTCMACPEDGATLMVLDNGGPINTSEASTSVIFTFLAAVGAATVLYLLYKVVMKAFTKHPTALVVNKKRKERKSYNSLETEEI